MRYLLLICLFSVAYAGFPDFSKNTTPATSSNTLSFMHLTLQYRKASDLAKILTKHPNSVLSKHGHFIADDSTNQLWIHDRSSRFEKITQLIHAMDKPKKQISIAVKMMAIDTNALEALGFHLTQNNATRSDSLPQHIEHTLLHTNGLQWWLNHLDAEITHGSGEMIATPILLVGNHNTASIESGQEIPYQERNHDGDTSTSFKSATLHLDVRPDLLPNQQVILTIHLNQDKVSEFSVAGMPAIQTEKIDTAVRAKNHETIILGGIYTHRLMRQKTEVPFLCHIPLVGRLFQHINWIWQRQELMIFVTPSW